MFVYLIFSDKLSDHQFLYSFRSRPPQINLEHLFVKPFHFTYFSIFLLIFYHGFWTLEEIAEFSHSKNRPSDAHR